MIDPPAPADLVRLAARVDELSASLTGLSVEVENLAVAVLPALPENDTQPAATPNRVSDSVDAEVPAPVYATLEQWVTEFFLPTFPRPIGGETRWCHRWTEHPEALMRLEALWRSWESLRLDPNLGMVTWLTHYLDPQLAALLDRGGTFNQCTPERHVSDLAREVAIW